MNGRPPVGVIVNDGALADAADSKAQPNKSDKETQLENITHD